MQGRTLHKLLSGLTATQPTIRSKKLAAVAVILSGEANPKTLLIRRAERADDPWSGQVAFPGGKMGEGDSSAKETAVRETREEVGVDLSREAEFAGHSVPFRTHTGDMDVIPTVFVLKREVKVVPNGEVSSHRWVDLELFLDPRSESAYHLRAGGLSRDMPAFAVGDYVVWGLTHRIISTLLGMASP